MSIQVSSVPEQTGLSTAAQQRQTFFERALNLAKGGTPAAAWVQNLRDRAVAQLQEQTFPTSRDEEWRFTDLSALVELSLVAGSAPVAASQIAAYLLPEAASSRLVFVDGVYAPGLSAAANLPQSLVIGNLASLASQGDRLRSYLAQLPGAEEVFTALNTVGLSDAAVVWVPKSLVVGVPIHLLFLSTGNAPTLSQPRCLVVAEPNSSVAIVEDYRSIDQGAFFTNSVTEIWLADNAEVRHTRVQRQNPAAFHIGKTAVAQARTSRYTCNTIDFGAKLSRHNLEIHQTGEQTETVLNGLTMIQGEQLSDTHSTIALTKPYGTTRQLHKCIIGDRAHAVFNGKVFVPKAAQLTDAGQLNRNLLLSPKARIDTKPQLEIVADNVKCAHGATVGQLDTDEVFYLQSRGIDADSARKLLIYAFAYEILDRLPLQSLRQSLARAIG